MISKLHSPTRIFLPLAALVLCGACVFPIAAGPTTTPDPGAIPGHSQTGSSAPAIPSPTVESILSLTPTFPFIPKPMGTATIAPVTMTAGRDLSCTTGPHEILYEHIANITEGEIVSLLARSTAEWPDYFYVRKSNSTECWAFGGSSSTSGDLSILPIRNAPPLPVITLTVQNNTYLYVVDVFIRGKEETAWGADRLAGGYIAPEGKFTLTLTAGFYDVQMIESMGGILFDKDDIPIGPESPYRNTVLDYEYLKVFQNLSENYLCRAVIRPLAGDIPITLTIPDDGIISPGEKVVLKALAGFYEVRLYRCEDGRPAAAINTVYIGPIPAAQTIT